MPPRKEMQLALLKELIFICVKCIILNPVFFVTKKVSLLGKKMIQNLYILVFVYNSAIFNSVKSFYHLCVICFY